MKTFLFILQLTLAGNPPPFYVGKPIRATPSQLKTLQAQLAQEKQLQSQIETQITKILDGALALSFEIPMRKVILN